MNEQRVENLIILGGGPAGYTAALYASRADLDPLLIEGFQWGGQLQNTTDVENYPGYPDGIMGPEMMNQFRAQAERFGTRFITDDATRVELSDGGLQRVFLGDEEHVAKTVILAMGAEPRRLGLPGEAWDAIATSGEAGIAALTAIASPVGFIGTSDDRAILEGRGVRFARSDDFTELACTGLDEQRRQVEDYRPQLERLAGRDVLMHCLNPDRIVVRGGVPEGCAGAIADLYAGLGGRVEWYGKPFPAIYRHALAIAHDPPASEVLAIGDALQTDVLGAARMGFDTVFVAGGIHAGEPFPADFGRDYGLGDWQPVAIVDGLA